MNKIQILDCTLRDGGYINNWNFGKQNISEIVSKLEQGNIDIIELGFLTNKTRTNDDSLFNNVEEMIPFVSNKLNVAMVNVGEFDVDTLPKSDMIAGIRIVFHKPQVKEAIDNATKLIKKGYLVFFQPMNTLSYSDLEFIKLIDDVNVLSPYAFYIVDTLGAMYPSDVARIYSLIAHNLDSSIKIGYHSHNNLQLAFANAITLIHTNSNRKIILDSSVCGIGRGAGNLATELITKYINNIENRYNTMPIFEIFDDILSKIYIEKQWGYNIPYALSAQHRCHPNYSSFLLDKQTVQVKGISEIIEKIDDNKKNIFDKHYVNELYLDYQQRNNGKLSELLKVSQLFVDRNLLILFPGSSIIQDGEKIKKFIEINNPLVISVNFIPDNFYTDILFIGNAKRIKQINNSKDSNSVKSIIATSNLFGQLEDDNVYFVDYNMLLDSGIEVIDNSGLMLFRLLIMLSIKAVNVAGFDGFNAIATAYFDNSYIYLEENQKAKKRTEYIYNQLQVIRQKININFITKSLYDNP